MPQKWQLLLHNARQDTGASWCPRKKFVVEKESRRTPGTMADIRAVQMVDIFKHSIAFLTVLFPRCMLLEVWLTLSLASFGFF